MIVSVKALLVNIRSRLPEQSSKAFQGICAVAPGMVASCDQSVSAAGVVEHPSSKKGQTRSESSGYTSSSAAIETGMSWLAHMVCGILT